LFKSKKNQKGKRMASHHPDQSPSKNQNFNDIGQFIIYNSPIGFFRSTPDPDAKFLFANPAFIKMFGYQDIDELDSIPCIHTYWDPADRKEIVDTLLTQGVIEIKEIQLKRKDGSVFWGSLTAKVVSKKSDNILYFDGAIVDITRRKDAVFKLLEEKKFSESIIESMPGLFWQFDESGRCIRWNKNVEAVYGYTSKELHELHVLKDMVTPENTRKLLDAAKNAMEGGSGYCEYDVMTKYGEKIAFAGDSRMVTINGKKYLTAVEIDITKRKQAEDKLKLALDEIRRLKEKTEAENVFLIHEINKNSEYGNVVGQSKRFKKVLSTARKVAPTNATALLLGESGTGKGVLAQLIHNLSPRHDKPLIKINCANLPANLLESILFGHEKGAFTNATSRKAGRFEVADGSTIFLDEIAELPLELQSKLLRVIEDGEFERLGGSKTISVDSRIIAATNRNLDEEVNAGRFRLDLMYRLNVYPITCPPLRQRKSDIPLLTHYLINKFNKSFGKSVSKISNKAMESLKNYPWPGNIRELQNVIERAIINTEGKYIDISGFESPNQLKSKTKILAEVERNHIISILDETDWVIEGKKGAAAILGINPSTLRGRMRKYSIQRPGNVTKF
jgi:PAS domain S-box-containing protein